MTDISCKGADSWSVIEKKWIQDSFLCNFCFFFLLFIFLLNQLWTKRGGKKSCSSSYNKVFERV